MILVGDNWISSGARSMNRVKAILETYAKREGLIQLHHVLVHGHTGKDEELLLAGHVAHNTHDDHVKILDQRLGPESWRCTFSGTALVLHYCEEPDCLHVQFPPVGDPWACDSLWRALPEASAILKTVLICALPVPDCGPERLGGHPMLHGTVKTLSCSNCFG